MCCKDKHSLSIRCKCLWSLSLDFYHCLVSHPLVNPLLIKFWGPFFGLEHTVHVNKCTLVTLHLAKRWPQYNIHMCMYMYMSCMYPSRLFIVMESFSLNLRKLECSQIKLWWLHESKEQNGQTCITNWSKCNLQFYLCSIKCSQ